MKSTTPSHYFPYLDVAKGIAIILVAMGHVMLFTFKINPSEPSKFIYFNMPVFFYISGFLAYKPILHGTEMFRKLLRRGMVLLFPYVIFFCLYDWFSTGQINFGTLLGGGSRYWFLYVLFLLSSFFIIYEYLTSRVKSNYAVVALLLLPYAALIAIKLYVSKLIGGGNLTEIITLLVNYYRYFLIGYFCRKYVGFYKLLFENQIVLAIGLVAYFANWYFFDMHNMLLIFSGTTGAIINLLALLKHISEKHKRICEYLSYIGKCSLGIYVIHYFFLPDMSAMSDWLLAVSNPFIVQLTAAVIVALPIVAGSIVVYKFFENNRVLYFLFFGKEPK